MTNTAEKIYTLPKELWLKLWDADCKPCRDNYYPVIEEIKNEFSQLENYLNNSIKDPEQKLQYLIDYVNNPDKAKSNSKHRIKDFLPEFISKFSNTHIIDIINEIEKSEGLFQYWQTKKHEIKCYNIDSENYSFYTHGLLITLIGELYDKIKQYECETLSQQDTSPAADEQGDREKSFKILAKKIGWKPDTDIKPLIKIIQDNTDYLWNYDFIKSDKINLIGETESQQITAILFFQNLLNEEFITHISRKKLNDLIMETFNFSFDVNNTNLSKTRNKINDGTLASKSKPIEERLTIKLAI